MRKPRGYEEAKSYSDGFQLPAGGYVVQILDTEAGAYSDGNEFLRVKFDIIEGEYKDYYRKQYEAQTFEPKKYKGTMIIKWPSDDGSESDEWKNRRLKSNIAAIEQSNEGYVWSWDENTLKGKIVGLVFCNAEYQIDDNHGWWTKPKWFVAADKIRSGKFKIPNDEPLKDNSRGSAEPMGFQPLDEAPPF